MTDNQINHTEQIKAHADNIFDENEVLPFTKETFIVHVETILGEIIEQKVLSSHNIIIKVIRNDELSEGFAAYLAPSLKLDSAGIVLLNIEATFHASADHALNPVDFLIENIMHETGHVLQEYFGNEFDEEQVEGIVEKYKERYMIPKDSKKHEQS